MQGKAVPSDNIVFVRINGDKMMGGIRSAIILFVVGWVLSFLFRNIVLTTVGCLALGLVLTRKQKQITKAAITAGGVSFQRESAGAPCPICSRQLNWIAQYSQWYCYSCKEYRQPAAERSPATLPRPPRVPPTEGAMKYCMECGVSIPERAKYCTKCGTTQHQR